MLALLIYCYANRLFSSRNIERATHRDVAVRFLTGNTHPDHDTICKFRRENFDAFNNAFVSVLELAQELKLLKLGHVAIAPTPRGASAASCMRVLTTSKGVTASAVRAAPPEAAAMRSCSASSPSEPADMLVERGRVRRLCFVAGTAAITVR